MLKEIYTAALGMVPQQTRLEVIANNMANANTSGYKKESVFERNLIDAATSMHNVPGSAEQEEKPTGSYVDFSQGNFQETTNPLDIAIDNPKGFFVLQDEAGKEFYTKSGSFKLSNDGTISAMDGKLLLGAGGSLNIGEEFGNNQNNVSDSKAVSLKITDQGKVFANEQEVGNVKLVNIENPESLLRVSNSEFIANDDTIANEFPSEEVSMKQGWIENSNVNIIREMVDMIELQRAFEAGSKVILANNETLDKSISMSRFY